MTDTANTTLTTDDELLRQAHRRVHDSAVASAIDALNALRAQLDALLAADRNINLPGTQWKHLDDLRTLGDALTSNQIIDDDVRFAAARIVEMGAVEFSRKVTAASALLDTETDLRAGCRG